MTIRNVGMWIWEMSKVGSPAQVASRAADLGLSHLIVKACDGPSDFKGQVTKVLVDECHNFGLKILAWGYAYGDDPQGEADAAIRALGTGADGFVIDAETEYQGKPNQANEYCLRIRMKYPDTFLAYAPFPIISLHPTYPYVEFGRHCDAAMPQMYWRTVGVSVDRMVQWTHDEWSAWEKNNPDSAKPRIPIGQMYGGVTAEEVRRFHQLVMSSGAENYWSWQHAGSLLNVAASLTYPAPIQAGGAIVQVPQQKEQEMSVVEDDFKKVDITNHNNDKVIGYVGFVDGDLAKEAYVLVENNSPTTDVSITVELSKAGDPAMALTFGGGAINTFDGTNGTIPLRHGQAYPFKINRKMRLCVNSTADVLRVSKREVY